jgi:hemoglobin
VDDGQTLYDRVGGDAFFARLVDAFYDGVRTDPVLLPLYPDHRTDPELSGARHRLTLFLIQYWGGPTTYSDERGHPRLRMRHFPFHIGADERDRWLSHMATAVERCTPDPDDADVRDALLRYFVPAAEHLRNETGLPISSSDPRTMQPGTGQPSA